jgi:1-acyl-sn-glycerol-3-phosphate acyltransferase
MEATPQNLHLHFLLQMIYPTTSFTIILKLWITLYTIVSLRIVTLECPVKGIENVPRYFHSKAIYFTLNPWSWCTEHVLISGRPVTVRSTLEALKNTAIALPSLRALYYFVTCNHKTLWIMLLSSVQFKCSQMCFILLIPWSGIVSFF